MLWTELEWKTWLDVYVMDVMAMPKGLMKVTTNSMQLQTARSSSNIQLSARTAHSFYFATDGISGTVRVLTLDVDYERDTTGILIDTLVVDSTNKLMMMMISVSRTRRRDFCALKKIVRAHFQLVRTSLRLYFLLYKLYIKRKLRELSTSLYPLNRCYVITMNSAASFRVREFWNVFAVVSLLVRLYFWLYKLYIIYITIPSKSVFYSVR